MPAMAAQQAKLRRSSRSSSAKPSRYHCSARAASARTSSSKGSAGPARLPVLVQLRASRRTRSRSSRGQVDPAVVQVFADVAQDVGLLQRDARAGRPDPAACGIGVVAEDRQAQPADGAGDPAAVQRPARRTSRRSSRARPSRCRRSAPASASSGSGKRLLRVVERAAAPGRRSRRADRSSCARSAASCSTLIVLGRWGRHRCRRRGGRRRRPPTATTASAAGSSRMP